MVSFQQDIILTIDKYNQEYQDKIEILISNSNLFTELSLEEAKKLINYIKQYKTLMSSVSLIIDKINNIKEDTNINKKIENELYAKIFPIMNIYRALLYEKYFNSTNLNNNNNNNNYNNNSNNNNNSTSNLSSLSNLTNIIQNLDCINLDNNNNNNNNNDFNSYKLETFDINEQD